jgi:hypothetical protein
MQLTLFAAAISPAGIEVDQQDCKSAGLYLGNELRDGPNVVEGDWSHTPCGCFVSPSDKAIHYDHGSTCRVDPDHEYLMICNRPAMGYDQLAPFAAAKCPAGTKVDQQDCKSTGLPLGNELRDRTNIVEDDWSHTPRGCFVSPSDKSIRYRYGSTCVIAEPQYAYELICKTTAVEYDHLAPSCPNLSDQKGSTGRSCTCNSVRSKRIEVPFANGQDAFTCVLPDYLDTECTNAYDCNHQCSSVKAD